MTGIRPNRRPRASIRARAVLAGGLVLGVSAGVTVAAWTDAERVSATFTGSTFGLQTSVQNGTYSAASTVTVTIGGLYPGTTGAVYVPFRVKTISGSVAGAVTLSATADAGTGLAPVLRYRIVKTTASCATAVFTSGASYVVGGFSAYQMVSAALPTTPGIPVAANGGSEAAYCVEFSLASGVSQTTYQGTKATATWAITGQSS